MNITKTLGIVAGAALALGTLAGCADEAGPPDQPTPGTNEEPSPETSDALGPDGDIIDNPPKYTWEDALEEALKETDGELLKVELEPNDTVGWEYELKFVTEHTKEEYKFNPDTLDPIGHESDDLDADSDEHSKRTFTADEIIDLAEAATIATDAQDGTVIEWKIEGKQGDIVQYEFEILPEGSSEDIEVTLDAFSGDILEIDD